jgi:hypothetical protein
LIQLKKETDERLRKLENFQLSNEVNERPHYKNYLGAAKFKRKKENPREWRKIIDNTKLTKEEQRTQVLKKVAQLEEEAKKNESMHTEVREQESIELYLNSIQAKLALLEYF